jgi:hypothetical protein
VKISVDVPPETLEGMLNGILLSLPKDALPPLYTSGIRYQSDPGEQWQLPAQTALAGAGDCEDLALYRAHELRTRRGEDARVKVYRSNPRTLHAIVRRADGTLEDPSRALGMLSMGVDAPFMAPAAPGAFPAASMPIPGMPAGMPFPVPLDPMTQAAIMFVQSPAGKKAISAAKRKLRKWWG